MEDRIFDCIIIGSGQSGLACAYYLRRTELSFVILDEQIKSGGAWQNCWDTLTLFSPAEFNSLPGTKMPSSSFIYPSKEEVIDYLQSYQEKYKFPIHHNTKVLSTHDHGNHYRLETTKGTYRCAALISATGTFSNPYIPKYSGQNDFKGEQFHSSDYRNAKQLKDKKTLIVGSGNSAAQLLAEVSQYTSTYWATDKTPSFLPENVNGHDLFQQATKLYLAQKSGQTINKSNFSLGDIVMVPSVRNGYKRGIYSTYKHIQFFSEQHVHWTDDSKNQIDVIIWCTGFGYATNHLSPALDSKEKGLIETHATRSLDQNGIWLVGYGNWTGFASATLIGVGRTAKKTVKEVQQFIEG